MSVNFTTTQGSHQASVVSTDKAPVVSQIAPEKLIMTQAESSSELFIPPPSNVRIPLDQLIQDKSAGEMATQLSRHWLKDAATRIFCQPLRSFLELVVNSLDASVDAEKSVGKFGMGFISILTFLEHPETQGCAIHIKTTTRESDKGLKSYSMDLFKEESYQVLFTDLDALKETGTCITLTPKSGEFSKETLERLFTYCQNLQFYEHGKIEVDYEGTTYVIGEGPKVLAWVSLSKDCLRVRDQGSGITKRVACKKLFVPSSSTKTQNLSAFPPQLPELKKFSGKKGNDAHFLISINGVIVIDLPLFGCKGNDLLLKMPTSTKLTLARDAIENRPPTIHYLKQVIALTIDTALKSEEAASCLLLLYKALKAWEDQVPSIAEAKLSTFLESTVHSTLKSHPELIPYPLEYATQFRALLPLNAQLVAFPSQLLMDHFESFEHFLVKEGQSRKDLIASKTVFFMEGVQQVSSFGLRNCVLAPLSFLDANPSKEQLQFRLVSQFADEGKSLEISQANNSLPESITNLRSLQSQPLVVITGRDSEPLFNGRAPLAHLKMFQDAEDAPFLDFWQKHEKAAREFASAVFYSETHFINEIAQCIDGDPEIQEQEKQTLACSIVCDENQYWWVPDPEAAWAELKKRAENILKNETYNAEHLEKLQSSLSFDFKSNFLKPLTPTEVSKLFFGWLFTEAGTEGMIYTAKEILWPVKEITTAYLESCFLNFCKKTFIASRSLSTLESQLDVWQGLEPFMDYPDHHVAIKAVQPLLLFQKELLQKKLTPQQQDKVKHCVHHLLACYHRFFTIKVGEVPIAYGTTLPPMQFPTLDCPEIEGSVIALVELVKSLSGMPHLFEKCLDLLSEEMQGRLDVEKRNKLMVKSLIPSVRAAGYGYTVVYAQSICFSTAMTYLSLAKASGVDPYFIETLLHYARTPFELTVMCFLLLSKAHKHHFVNPRNKEKIGNVLIYFITVYLQQKNEPTYEESYEKFRFFNETIIGAHEKLSRLIDPMVSYLEEIDGAAFDMDVQMTPEPILARLHVAKEFTTIQVIHAAKNDNHFSKALKDGDLACAVEAVRKESKKTELQMVTQAVEHGSERSGVAATLTEAFQNSVDAQRGYLKKHPNAPQKKAAVSFDVRLMDQKDPRLLLEVADHIGMPSLETLLVDFLIPNYSKKENDSEAVGEMGNGSYQMYREAEMVTVKTRTLDTPSRVYFLRIVPIRDPHTHEVIDLSHKCIDITDITEAEFEGTTLRVLMKKKEERSQMSLEVEGLGIRQFISETFSVAHPPLGENHVLQCMLKLPNGKQKPLQEIKKEYTPFKIPNCSFTCYKMENDQTPGYVLTDGYPFKSLRTFLIEENILPQELVKEVDRGWCLNLPKGSYMPVQSRTRVQMTQEIKKQLQRFLLEWIYLRACTGEKTGLGTRYYPHMQASDSNFSQMFPNTNAGTHIEEAVLTKGDYSSLEAFFVHYQPAFLQHSFLGHIKKGYKSLVSGLEAMKTSLLEQVKNNLKSENRESTYDRMVRKFTGECKKIVQEWKASLKGSNPYEQLFFDHVLRPWFENKVESFIKYPPTLKDLVSEHKHLQNAKEKASKEIAAQKTECKKKDIKEHLTTAAAVLSHYCFLYSERIPMKAPKPPLVHFTYTKTKNFGAYYTAASNEIVVNLAYHSLSEILKLGQKIARYEPVKDDTLISISYRKSGWLNHELEHARRCQDCHDENVHGRDYNHEGNYIDFEACAASWAKRAYQLGLFDQLALLLQKLTFPSEQALENLCKIEKEYPELLLEAL